MIFVPFVSVILRLSAMKKHKNKVLTIFLFLLLLSKLHGQKVTWNYFLTSDSVKIGYIDQGSAKLGTIIFLHGGLGYHSSYLIDFAQSLSRDFRIVIYDQRGAGISQHDISLATVGINRFINDLYELQVELKIDSAIILGHSFGGLLALEYSMAYPDKVAALIVYDGLADSPTALTDRIIGIEKQSEAMDAALVSIIERKKQGQNLTFQEFGRLLSKQSIYWYDYSKAGPLFFNKTYENFDYKNHQLDEAIPVIKKFYDQGILTDYSVLRRVGNIDKPTLIVVGKYDHVITPSQATALSESMVNSQIKILEKSGHYGHLEEPNKFRELIYNFALKQGKE